MGCDVSVGFGYNRKRVLTLGENKSWKDVHF